MIGLMNVLHLEGAKNNIRVNTLAPTAATGMTEGLLPAGDRRADDAGIGDAGGAVPRQRERALAVILGAGAGVFAVTHIEETPGVFLAEGRAHAGDDRRAFRGDRRLATARPLDNAFGQTFKFVRGRGEALGVTAVANGRIVMREAVIVSTARTPIGKAYRGAFNDTQAQTLGGHAIAHARRARRRRAAARSTTSSWARRCSRARPAAMSRARRRCARACRPASPACRSTGNAPPA